MTGRLRRFGVAERSLHWAVALPLLAALGSGLLLGWGDRIGLRFNHFALRRAHIIAGLATVVAPVVVALAGASSAAARHRLGGVLGALAGRGGSVPGPAFNSGQEAFAGFVAAGVVLELVSGVELWQWHWFSLDLRSGASALHQWLAYGFAVSVIGHVYFAAVHPSTRWALPGMFTGSIDQGRAPAPPDPGEEPSCT